MASTRASTASTTVHDAADADDFSTTFIPRVRLIRAVLSAQLVLGLLTAFLSSESSSLDDRGGDSGAGFSSDKVRATAESESLPAHGEVGTSFDFSVIVPALGASIAILALAGVTATVRRRASGGGGSSSLLAGGSTRVSGTTGMIRGEERSSREEATSSRRRRRLGLGCPRGGEEEEDDEGRRPLLERGGDEERVARGAMDNGRMSNAPAVSFLSADVTKTGEEEDPLRSGAFGSDVESPPNDSPTSAYAVQNYAPLYWEYAR